MALLNNTPQQYYDSNDFGNYQFVSLKDIINQFMLIYVGEDKIIPKARRIDVAFHAQRALAELSFDTFKSYKSQELTIPASLKMTLPQDYVSYTKISLVDSVGVKHLLYPTSYTSNPFSNPLQDSDGDFKLQVNGALTINSNDIVIDAGGDEDKILVGMAISGPYIPSGAIVTRVTHSSTKTTISIGEVPATSTLYTVDYDDVEATNTATSVPLTFTNTDGSLILPKESIISVDGITTNLADPEMSAATASSIENVKVGMIVSSEFFPIGTVVEAVYGTTIVVSELATGPVQTFAQVTFVSPDLIDTDTWSKYKSAKIYEDDDKDYDYEDRIDPDFLNRRYGLDPQHAQINGSFYIDEILGKIHFSSNISGKTVILDYVSDSLGTDSEMQVHKFAEEAMYKWISHAILSGKANIPEYQVNRLKRERSAAIRTAKLRLSNLNIEELTQILRGKSKWIKH